MRHAILGNGNLGNALAKELTAKNIECRVFSYSSSWKYPASGVKDICKYNPTHVWCTVGAGSVDQAKQNYIPFIDLHIKLPMELIQNLKEDVVLHFFSTEYCSTKPQSLYALSKTCMEESVRMTGRPNTYIYRIGSLYGTHKPKTCFPYKLKANAGDKSLLADISLPSNCVSPTPVDWLAETLLEMLEKYKHKTLNPIRVHPNGCCTVKEWGELILGREVIAGDKDPLRPLECVHMNQGSGIPTWLELWDERKNWYWYVENTKKD